MSETTTATARRRVLSGMRPTGRLHLGNYMGALYNWVRLQEEYECYFFIADVHALTTEYANPGPVLANIDQVALDFLSAGLDPAKCVLFQQHYVPQHAELNMMLEMITPLGWLERVPTYKDQQEQLKEKDLNTFGFLGYPVLQSADILLYKPDFVPVGQDQAAHVELTRELARRFNHLYGGRHVDDAKSDKERLAELEQEAEVDQILPEPKVLLTPSPKLPGTDGRKMSKSYKNTIEMAESDENIRAKLKTMVTDPARIRRTDPGNPDICPVGDLHKVFSTPEVNAEVRQGCTSAGIGCIQCKGWAADSIVREIAPIRERRASFEARPDDVQDILRDGERRARVRAAETMEQVYRAMGLRR